MSDDRWNEPTAAPKAAVKRVVTEADYPFQPELEHRLRELQGLERLRAMRDRRLAQLSLETFQTRQIPTLESKQIFLPLKGASK